MKHKCINCGRVRDEKFMYRAVFLEHGVSVKDLYPEKNKSKVIKWECGDCEENARQNKQLLNRTSNY